MCIWSDVLQWKVSLISRMAIFKVFTVALNKGISHTKCQSEHTYLIFMLKENWKNGIRRCKQWVLRNKSEDQESQAKDFLKTYACQCLTIIKK